MLAFAETSGKKGAILIHGFSSPAAFSKPFYLMFAGGTQGERVPGSGGTGFGDGRCSFECIAIN